MPYVHACILANSNDPSRAQRLAREPDFARIRGHEGFRRLLAGALAEPE